MTRATTLAIATAAAMAGCGSPAPPSDMPARTSKYYMANPAEIEPMQRICRQWASSQLPAAAQPAVVTTNCREAAFAKSMLAYRDDQR